MCLLYDYIYIWGPKNYVGTYMWAKIFHICALYNHIYISGPKKNYREHICVIYVCIYLSIYVISFHICSRPHIYVTLAVEASNICGALRHICYHYTHICSALRHICYHSSLMLLYLHSIIEWYYFRFKFLCFVLATKENVRIFFHK